MAQRRSKIDKESLSDRLEQDIPIEISMADDEKKNKLEDSQNNEFNLLRKICSSTNKVIIVQERLQNDMLRVTDELPSTMMNLSAVRHQSPKGEEEQHQFSSSVSSKLYQRILGTRALARHNLRRRGTVANQTSAEVSQRLKDFEKDLLCTRRINQTKKEDSLLAPLETENR